MSIADNLRHVRDRIAAAALSAGRNPAEIVLVGVTKYVGPREAAELFAAGCHDLGESRPQELWQKAAALTREPTSTGDETAALPAARWHLIGHLQRNKIRRTAPLVTLIHSVDSERLLAAICETCDTNGSNAPMQSPVPVLLEVNTSGDAAKHGLAPADVEPLLAAVPQYPGVAVRGLMTMAALEGGDAVAARNFAALRDLRDRLTRNAPPCVSLDELSMGMSGDFEIAIREGATMVRIGSLLWE